MQINTVTVTAARSVNHPYNSYERLEPKLTLTATMAEGEDPEAATKALQVKAESMVEAHKVSMLDDLHKLQRASQISNQIARSKQNLELEQKNLASLQAEAAKLGTPLPLPDVESEQDVPF